MPDIDSDALNALLAGLSPELRAQLAALPPERLAQALAGTGGNDDKRSKRAKKPSSASGDLVIDGQTQFKGVAVAKNLGTIIFNRTPEEDERRRLIRYLGALSNNLYNLPLRGIGATLEEGRPLSMPQVYVMLATASTRPLDLGKGGGIEACFDTDDVDALRVDWRRHVKRELDEDWARPDRAIVDVTWLSGLRARYPGQSSSGLRAPHPGHPDEHGEQDPVDIGPPTPMRSSLAAELVAEHSKLVLLGDPGSGKSTFVRHLAWALAQRGLEKTPAETKLPGWPAARRLLPIVLPLRELAGRLAAPDPGGLSPVFGALRAVMLRHDVQNVDDILSASLDNGAALVLFDGLDEVPTEGEPGKVASRRTTLEAVRDFAAMHAQCRFTLTCRTRAFDASLRRALGWPVETLAPFTLGQVRAFTPAFYGELVRTGQMEPHQVDGCIRQLVDETIAPSPKLRGMAGIPLLLTMMALVLHNKGTLPRDRPKLYEAVLDLLLGQWDKVREGQSLADVIGDRDWDSGRIRIQLNQLSYEAHKTATSADGRGSLPRALLRDALTEFFTVAELKQPADVAERCLRYFVDRSGLIVPGGNNDYVFAHLTLQEHCAGCHMVVGTGALARIMDHRADDRWREPIMLGLGYIQAQRPELIGEVLDRLIDRNEHAQDGRDAPKPVDRWHRDLIFAAEIGADRDWSYLRQLNVKVAGEQGLQSRLRNGLVALLADASQPLATAERVRAGFLLGDLGDPRFPVTIEAWRREVDRALGGDTTGYFCRVDAGTYVIGSTDADPGASDDEKPQHTVVQDHPIWIGRFPITNAQWDAWVAEGGWPGHFRDDTDLNHPSQPAVGLSAHAAEHYCKWLGGKLDLNIRLATELEWEAAARGGDDRRYPWGNEWHADRAASDENRPNRGGEWSIPVGCFPAGSAPCGALDMAGNVWEWTTSVWKSYPGATKRFQERNLRVLRGGWWGADPTRCRCGARRRLRPDLDLGFSGLRVVLAPSARRVLNPVS